MRLPLAFQYISSLMSYFVGSLIVTFFLSGCAQLKYFMQAGQGQFALFNRARPLSEVAKDERVPPRIRALLSEIAPIKSFGQEKGLKPTGNYTKYVQLDRPAAVWVVSASEAYQFRSKEWSFPIVGSFPYLGWFDLSQAKVFADELRKEGWDVDVRGAAAYSTLGWFNDPILSSMLREGGDALGELVNVILHESVHATLYINGQAYFNESLANFIADILTLEYLDRKAGRASPERLAYVAEREKGKTRGELFHATYEKLAALYGSPKSQEEKREQKTKLLADLKKVLNYSREINNATLIQFKSYHTGQTEFAELLERCHGDLRKFLGTLSTLNSKSFSKGQQEDLAPVLAKVTCL